MTATTLAFSSRMQFVSTDGTLTREGTAFFQALLDRSGGAIGEVLASSITNTPNGGIAAVNVQAAIDELDTEKATTAALTAHTGDTANPHSTTKAHVGLSNVDNTSDANKPVSTAQQTALDLKANTADLGTIASQDANAVAITGGTIGLATGSLGYATGNGGAVTQITNKATGVTLNKPSGEITMDAANLADGITISFTLTNSTIAATDVLAMNVVSGATAGGYKLNAICGAGSASIQVTNQSGGALAEAIVIRFVVIKGAVS